ncbi:hypothetical protein [Halovulum sp. GXIMD14793]
MSEQTREKMIEDLHKFFMSKPLGGGKSRAEKIDQLLLETDRGKFLLRVAMWSLGALVAILAGVGTLLDFLKKIWGP